LQATHGTLREGVIALLRIIADHGGVVTLSRWQLILGLAALLILVAAVDSKLAPLAQAAAPAPSATATPGSAAPAKSAATPTPTARPAAGKGQQAQRSPHLAYVYPAGGRQGETFQVTVGGEFLDGVADVRFTGTGVKATVVEYDKPMPPMVANQLRDQLRELLDRKAAVTGIPNPMAPKATPTASSAAAAKASSTPTPSAPAPAAPAAADTHSAGIAASAEAPPAAKFTWTDEDVAKVAEIRKKLATFVRKPTSPALAETVTLQVTVAPDAEPGHHELRLGTPLGLTNPIIFCVGQLPEFSEKVVKHAAEPSKSVPRGEMTITLPATVNGQIMAGGVNRYRFQAREGQRLVIAVSARELMPYLADAVPGWFQATLTLVDGKGNELAYDDDYRFNPDPVIFFKVPQGGEYAIEIKDAIYRGREDFVYRIAVGELPFVTDIFPLGGPAGAQTDVEVVGWNLPATKLTMDARGKPAGVRPLFVRKDGVASNVVPFEVGTLPECLKAGGNHAAATAQAVTLPVVINGRVEKPQEWDVYRFEGHAGDEVVAEVMARRLGSPLDSVLKLTDAAGKQIAFNDDYEDKGSGLITHHADSYLRVKLPADGAYYVHLGDAEQKGGTEYAYRLRLSAPRPDFELRLAPSSLSVRGGTSNAFTVYAIRRDGFSGEISIAMKGAPASFVLSGDRIPAGKDQVELTLTVRPMPAKEYLTLRLEGRATIGGREVVRPAVPAEDTEQAFAYHHLVPSQELLVVVRPAGGAAGPLGGGGLGGGGGQGTKPAAKQPTPSAGTAVPNKTS
jgi:hypothetical protein